MSIHYNRPFAEPEVDPFFADGMVTFSQQRYVPRPRPLLPVARTILPSHQRQIHALYIEAATSKVTFSRARTLVGISFILPQRMLVLMSSGQLPLNFTHEGDAFARVGQDFWMRKVRNSLKIMLTRDRRDHIGPLSL
jgi:hypothetical protein